MQSMRNRFCLMLFLTTLLMQGFGRDHFVSPIAEDSDQEEQDSQSYFDDSDQEEQDYQSYSEEPDQEDQDLQSYSEESDQDDQDYQSYSEESAMQEFGEDQYTSFYTEESDPDNRYISEKPKSHRSKTHKRRPVVEIKAGYFFFSNHILRKIYNNGGLDAQVNLSYPIWRWLQIYGSVEYFEKHGRSLNAHQKTRIWEIPLSLGLKTIIPLGHKAQYYITLGPRYFFVDQDNSSSFVSTTMSGNGLGCFGNTGVNFLLNHHLLVDVFGEFSYKRMLFHSSKHHVYGRSIQIGGYTFGLGLGYTF